MNLDNHFYQLLNIGKKREFTIQSDSSPLYFSMILALCIQSDSSPNVEQFMSVFYCRKFKVAVDVEFLEDPLYRIFYEC
jgi:hypothetical protein